MSVAWRPQCTPRAVLTLPGCTGVGLSALQEHGNGCQWGAAGRERHDYVFSDRKPVTSRVGASVNAPGARTGAYGSMEYLRLICPV